MADRSLKRLFIGVALPIDLKDKINNCKAKVENDLSKRWVRRDNAHLTIKFLGKCDISTITLVEKLLVDVARDIKPFFLNTTKWGCFPNPGKARILWLGLSEDENLTKLKIDIEAAAATLGFEEEKRRFHPHITVARLKKPARIDLDALNDEAKIDHQIKISKVTLFESVLMSSGAEYSVLKEVKLLA